MYRPTKAPKATTAAALLAVLAFTAGCSGGSATTTAAAPTPSSAAVTPAAAIGPLDGLTALEVWEKAKTAAADATSMHVAAKLQDGEETIGLNLKMDEAGKAFGALTFNGDKLTVRRLGETMYFKADRGFWTANADAATATALANKWIMVKQGFSADLEQFFQLTDMDFILDDALALSSAEQKTLKLARGITVGTQKTVGLADETASEADEFQTLYVAAADPALPVNFAIGSDNSQYMKFRSWNQDFTVIAPKGAIDLAAAD